MRIPSQGAGDPRREHLPWRWRDSSALMFRVTCACEHVAGPALLPAWLSGRAPASACGLSQALDMPA